MLYNGPLRRVGLDGSGCANAYNALYNVFIMFYKGLVCQDGLGPGVHAGPFLKSVYNVL
jgi:hypothetical protein